MDSQKLISHTKPVRHQYVIGDLQGCYQDFKALLKKVEFAAAKDRLWLTGDLVARGEDSLSCLLAIKELSDQGAATTVLGNHDLNLLAVWRGFREPKKKDRIEKILAYKHVDDLMHWLRRQPILVNPSPNTYVSHAGIPHIWSVEQAKKYAGELQQILAGNIALMDDFLKNMYGNEPANWRDQLKNGERSRAIANYFTRMRLIKNNGTLDFEYKGDVNGGSQGDWPQGFYPWYAFKRADKANVIFGHWAALEGHTGVPFAHAVDGGCVWGGRLIAQRLDDHQRFSVLCRS